MFREWNTDPGGACPSCSRPQIGTRLCPACGAIAARLGEVKPGPPPAQLHGILRSDFKGSLEAIACGREPGPDDTTP